MGDQITVQIEQMAAGGNGLARIDGRVVFLPGVLPGEEVLAERTASRSDYDWARPIRILAPHPDRIDSCCPLFMTCGGCQLLHIEYGAQFKLKTKAALEGIAEGFEGEIRFRPSPKPLYYRDRVRLQIGKTDGRRTVGFFGVGSRRLVPVRYCYQLNPVLNEALPEICGWVEGMSGSDGAPTGLSLLAGREEEGILAVLDLPGKPGPNIRRVIRDAPASLSGIFFSVKGRLFGKPVPEKGVTVLELQDQSIRLTAGPGAFTQINGSINRLIAEDLVAAARESTPGHVLDLYAGLGNFTFPLSKAAGFVTAVEENPAAAASARINQKNNNIKNVKMIRGDAVKEARKAVERGERCDMIVLDPPRSGARGLAVAAAGLGAKELVYISCHPAAMARDMAELRSVGYSLAELTVYDMFPQTAHVEVAARLKR